MYGDRQRTDDHAEDAVVDRAREHSSQRIGGCGRHSEGAEEHVQDHRIGEAGEEDCHDRADRPQMGEPARQDRGRPDADEKREGRRTEGSLCENVKREASDECPDQSGLDADGDRDDDRQNEHRVGVGRADPEIWDDGEFDEGRHHSADRSE